MTANPYYTVWSREDDEPRGGVSRWPWLRFLGAGGLLGLLVWRLGSGPFVTGLESVSPEPVAAAVVITLVTTVCSAWRWCAIARGLQVGLPMRRAVPAYYRSQFLNVSLPGGVIGDLHRGVRYGRVADDLGGGLRAVAWERTVGQVVQGTVTAGVLLAYASPVPTQVPEVVLAAVALGAVGLLALRHASPRGTTLQARALRTLRTDLGTAVLPRRTWPVLVFTSLVVFAGHTAILVIAARSVGVTTPMDTLLPLAMLVLLAASVPLNIAGWGLREGAAAWVFAAAGLGVADGIATTTAFGVMTVVATLPGVVVLAVSALRHRGEALAGSGEARGASEPATGESGPRHDVEDRLTVAVRREEVTRG